ncbi:MAG: histidine phosphatase family protein [Candidatus Roizmanbacteria bacterium]|nr:histidine phosphatase family protein [Candidatus Roizmanbacteria bacterium]
MQHDKTIIFARHGETNFNINKQIQDPIEPYLTTKGHMQAQSVGKKIKEQGWQFDSVFCADTTRTKETLTDIDLPNVTKNNSIHITQFLNERFHKELVGKNKDNVSALVGVIKDRLSWELYFEGTDKSILTGRFPNNETLQNVQTRVEKLMIQIYKSTAYYILLIGSSIINQYILEYMQYGSIGNQQVRDFKTGQILDFQKNNELRMVTLDGNNKIKIIESIDL